MIAGMLWFVVAVLALMGAAKLWDWCGQMARLAKDSTPEEDAHFAWTEDQWSRAMREYRAEGTRHKAQGKSEGFNLNRRIPLRDEQRATAQGRKEAA